MKDVSLKELIDLIEADVPESESKIEKMFEWHFNRSLTVAKWIWGLAASLFIALLASYFKEEIKIEVWQTIGIIFLSLATASYGFFKMYQIRSIQKQFVSSLKIYSSLKKIFPFIILYRRK